MSLPFFDFVHSFSLIIQLFYQNQETPFASSWNSFSEVLVYFLHSNLNIYNKITKSNIKIFDLKFNIEIIDKKKLFKNFYIRFSITIASLEFINIYKISNLK